MRASRVQGHPTSHSQIFFGLPPEPDARAHAQPKAEKARRNFLDAGDSQDAGAQPDGEAGMLHTQPEFPMARKPLPLARTKWKANRRGKSWSPQTSSISSSRGTGLPILGSQAQGCRGRCLPPFSASAASRVIHFRAYRQDTYNWTPPQVLAGWNPAGALAHVLRMVRRVPDLLDAINRMEQGVPFDGQTWGSECATSPAEEEGRDPKHSKRAGRRLHDTPGFFLLLRPTSSEKTKTTRRHHVRCGCHGVFSVTRVFGCASPWKCQVLLGLRQACCVLAAWVHATPGNCNGRSSSTCKNLRRQTTTWHSAEASHGKVPGLVNHCPGKLSPPPCPGSASFAAVRRGQVVFAARKPWESLSCRKMELGVRAL